MLTFFSYAIDDKYRLDDLYSSGAVGFVIKTKLLQADCFARRMTKCWFDKDETGIATLEKEYKRVDKWEGKMGIFNKELDEDNPVALFMDKMKTSVHLSSKSYAHRLALLCFYHEYHASVERDIFSECCRMPQEHLHKGEAEVAEFLNRYPQFTKLTKVMRLPAHVEGKNKSRVKEILECYFTAVGNSDYKKHIGKEIADLCRPQLSLLDLLRPSNEK